MIYLRTSVGIELRGDDLLISSLQSNISGGVFSHFGRIAGYQLRDKRDVREEIDHFFKSKKLNKYGILLGIQRKDVILRYLNLPAEVKDNLKQVVRYQVQSFEPTEEDSFHYDYIQLPGNGTRKKLAVLMVMIKKTFLDSQLQLLRYFGIRPVAVTVNSIALANLLLHSRKDIHDKTYILADLTPSGIELLAVHHGSLAYSREINKEYGQGWGNLILNEVGEAAGNIRLGPNDVIEGIVLVGESSEAACQEIEASITDCQLLKSILPFEVLPENKAYIQEAASAIGLAFTGMVRHPPFKLNLLPAELRIHQTRWTYLPPIILGLTILALLIALGFRPMVQNRILIRKLDQEIQSLQTSVNRVQSIQRQAETLEKRISFIEGLLRNRDLNLEVLQELTALLPADTFLNSYSNREGSIQLSGASGSAPDLIPNLEKSLLLKEVAQRGTMFKDAQTGKDRFNIEAKLER